MSDFFCGFSDEDVCITIGYTSMRDIFERFVNTGQIPAPNGDAMYGLGSEDNPANVAMDITEVADVVDSETVVTEPVEVDTETGEVASEDVKE